jgi:hypothetical protein
LIFSRDSSSPILIAGSEWHKRKITLALTGSFDFW